MDHEPAPLAPGLSGDLCGLSQCRRPLPARTGRGPRYEYCPDRPWDYDGKTLTCRDLGDAEKKWTTVFGRAPADAVLADLREAVATAREPLTGLTAVLERVGTAVDEHAGAALAEAERDRAARAEAEGRARTAEAETAAAHRGRQDAEGERDEARAQAREAERAAERARGEAADDRRAAAVAQGAAGRLEQENERLRAEATELQMRAERAEARLETVAKERDRFRDELQTERKEWTTERTRLTGQVERLSADYAERLDELQQAHTGAQERTAREHTAQVADLQRQAGRAEVLAERIRDLEEELRAEQNRHRDWDQARTRIRQDLETVLRQLREKPHTPQEDLVDLVVRTLQHAQAP